MAQDQLRDEIVHLQEQVQAAKLPLDLREKLSLMIKRLGRMLKFGRYTSEYEQTATYIQWLTSLPWQTRSEDLLELKQAKIILDQNHYGLNQIKERILEYLAVLILRKKQTDQSQLVLEDKNVLSLTSAPILCFVGLVGTGKTTLASAIAQAMHRKFIRIPFGGMGSALDLRGQSRVHPDAEAGLVLKAIKRCGTKNPVILLDEIDRVSPSARSEIMGVLVELLDPEQNMAFRDHFVDYPFDLSEVLFITTCNNTTNISVAVLDRLEPMQMPSYNDNEKIVIAKDYVLPKRIKQAGLTASNLQIDDDVWPLLVRPLGYDAGIRTLGRMINSLCRKVAKMIVEGKGTSFRVTKENLREYVSAW
ncbi:AAA family ATPase [Patescibacteria group bacterium]